MLTTTLTTPAPSPFDFVATAHAHGWLQLAPFAWRATAQAVRRVEQLADGQVVLLTIAAAGTPAQPAVRVVVQHPQPLTPADTAALVGRVRHMLRLDEDLSAFYVLCHTHGAPWQRLTTGGGRLLRSPTVFEDIVKTICTTNTTWQNTVRMVAALVATLGAPYAGDATLRAFPTPQAIAAADPTVLTAHVRMGYRAACTAYYCIQRPDIVLTGSRRTCGHFR